MNTEFGPGIEEEALKSSQERGRQWLSDEKERLKELAEPQILRRLEAVGLESFGANITCRPEKSKTAVGSAFLAKYYQSHVEEKEGGPNA